MPRNSRQTSVTGIYHVIARGQGEQIIFYEREDYEEYLKRLERYSDEHFTIYCFCLMDNHVHLLVKSTDLSLYMKKITVSFVAWYNRKYDRKGWLFLDRFKSEPVEEEGYLMRCVRYILQNPLKAGICKDISSYPWGSFSFYYSKRKTWMESMPIELLFGNKEEFLQFVQEKEIIADTNKLEIEKRISDYDLIRLWQKALGERNYGKMEKEEKVEFVRYIGQETNASVRQLARISGFGRGLLYRLKKK